MARYIDWCQAAEERPGAEATATNAQAAVADTMQAAMAMAMRSHTTTAQGTKAARNANTAPRGKRIAKMTDAAATMCHVGGNLQTKSMDYAY